MDKLSNLIKVHTPELGSKIELFRNPSPDDFWSDDYDAGGDWNLDSEGAGLIVYCYTGKRQWVKTSVSKTPFSFLKKQLDSQPEYLTHVLVVKGTPEYPLTDSEIKTVSGLLVNRMKNTEVASFSSYTTVGSQTPGTMGLLEDAVERLATLLNEFEYDLTVSEPETKTAEELRTFSEVFESNGVITTVQVKLSDDENPDKGVQFVSVKVTDTLNVPLLYANSGTYSEQV